MSGDARYARRHLEHSDYYDEHRRVQGEWYGRGAEFLGLSGKVIQEQFEAVREGLHPESGEFHPSQRPREEQQRAVHHVLDSRDFAINLRGAAGTGKTATLHEIDRGLRDAGREIVAVAPTRGAVEELRKVGFHDAMTISRLLEANAEQSSLLGSVLVVDEAGMVSGRQMERLLKLAEREGARILFSGDTRQIQSVEASDALRILERESQMKSVSLTEVQRQTQAEYRDAIQTLRQAPEEGFQKLEQLGAIREVPYLSVRWR